MINEMWWEILPKPIKAETIDVISEALWRN